MTYKKQAAISILTATLLSACGGGGGGSSSATETTTEGTTTTDNTSTTTTTNNSNLLNTSHFRSISSSTTVGCMLSNGASTTCHQLVFNVNQIVDGANSAAVDDEAGPFCPSSDTATDGGIGNYDGTTSPGLQRLGPTLWANMATDGYDLIDEVNNLICTQDFFAGTQNLANCNGARCLTSSANDTLTATFLIPVTPQNLTTPNSIGTVEAVGVSLDGIPITGTPPSVVTANGKIPSIDPCGGHHDPSGYYHWHFVPESMDTVLTAQSISGVTCASKITQDESALTGYAGDGYPIYAYKDTDGTTPTDLDSCNGHTGTTTEFTGEVYHYHASETAVTSLPPCLTGASVNASPTIN